MGYGSLLADYREAAEYLRSGRDPTDRPLPGRATRLQKRADGSIAVKYHDTDVFTWLPDGAIRLNSGGFRTVTTKARINEYLPQGMALYQERGIWYLSLGDPYPFSEGCKRLVFADGMMVKPDGEVEGGADDREAKAQLRLAEQINAYARRFARALVNNRVSAPSGGDCWFCSMVVAEGPDEGKPLGEAQKNRDHLRQHIQGMSFVGSLLANAVRATPMGAYPRDAVLRWLYYGGGEAATSGQFDWTRDLVEEQARRALRRYLRAQLGLAS